MTSKNKTFASKKMVFEAIKYWQKQLLAESTEPEEQALEEHADVEEALDDKPNTVGALIKLLQRRCKMDDVICPRNEQRKEMMLIDVYSQRGRAVLDFVDGVVPGEIALT